MILKKVISGLQTGADIGGVKAAKAFGLEYRGLMPRCFRTETGSKREYLELYNAKTTMQTGYMVRTRKNVEDSDATIIFDLAGSNGSKSTRNYCKKIKKPYLYLTSIPKDCYEVSDWLVDNNIVVLNVAGNRESKSKGIEKKVIKFLTEVFNDLQNNFDYESSES